jgi:hypothetical protein
MDYDSSVFLVTLSDLKTYLGYDAGDLDDDEILGHMLQIVREQFDEYCDRTLLAADHTEYYSGDGARTLVLANYPVNSTRSEIAVYVDQDQEFGADTQLDEDDIAIDSSAGILHYVGGSWPRGDRNIKVVYNAGHETVPYDLKGITYTAVSRMWKQRQDKHWGYSTFSRGDFSMSLIDGEYTAREMAVLNRYAKRPRRIAG